MDISTGRALCNRTSRKQYYHTNLGNDNSNVVCESFVNQYSCCRPPCTKNTICFTQHCIVCVSCESYQWPFAQTSSTLACQAFKQICFYDPPFLNVNIDCVNFLNSSALSGHIHWALCNRDLAETPIGNRYFTNRPTHRYRMDYILYCAALTPSASLTITVMHFLNESKGSSAIFS